MSTPAHTLVNGQAQTQVDVSDRGLQYGDGLFETIAVSEGTPRYWQRHMARLQAGCARLGLPGPDPQRLRFEADHLLQHQPRCVLKILLTRGVSGRGYCPQPGGEVTRILRRLDWPALPADGLRLMRCATTLGRNPQLAGIKHLNRLEQVLASRELAAHGADEGLLADSEARVIEGTKSNLFLVRDGAVITPELCHAGVAGVLRSVLLDVCNSHGIECHVRPVSWAEVDAADELFMTNSLMGVEAVRQWNTESWPAGPLTRQLQQLLAQAPEGEEWYP